MSHEAAVCCLCAEEPAESEADTDEGLLASTVEGPRIDLGKTGSVTCL